MNNAILLTCILFTFVLSSGSVEATHYISDFDDTIKSYTKKKKSAVLRQRFHRTAVYPGAEEFYAGVLRDSASSELSILTAAVRLLLPNIKKTLKNIDYKRLIIRESVFKDKEDYKNKALARLLDETSKQRAVLIGDDTSADPLVYAKALKEYPSQVSAAYIHIKENNTLPSRRLRPFYVYAELALMEYASGRLSVDALKSVLAASLQAQPEELIPPHHYCPTELQLGVIGNTAVDRSLQRLRAKLREFCAR